MPAKKFNIFSSVVFWICLAFVIWIFAFRGFLSSKLAIFEDAISYHDHIKFYIENLAQGVFPLWDPFWCNGAPNDFFLRRIGVANPFYFLIALMQGVGIPYNLAYLWFFALYYWSGMIAFYLLAMRIYQNRLIAYAGYLILLFSSLGTRIFDSYMMLITVPLLWFFYCFISFSQTARKSFFLGACLSFIILSSTYIPFYFLSCLVFFVVFFVIFYFKEVPVIASRYHKFLMGNKILVILSLFLVFFSFVPLVHFFESSNKGQIVLPARHGSPEIGQTLIVPSRTLDWGAVEDIMFSTYFTDWRNVRFAVIYIPLFAFIVFILGLLGRLSRRACFLFTGGFVFLCCLVSRGLPFYDFLNQHLFFLKYFRNLHFFLWFALIPLFILLVLEHWKIFSEIKLNGWLTLNKLLFFVWSAHFIAIVLVFFRGDGIVSTFVVLFLSAVFWTLFILGRLKNPMLAFGLLTLVVVLQPLEVYHYLTLRTNPSMAGLYDYGYSFTTLELKGKEPVYSNVRYPVKSELYYAASNYNLFYRNISNYAVEKYLQYKFTLVDHLQVIEFKDIPFDGMEDFFRGRPNKAFIFKLPGHDIKITGNDPNPSFYAQRIGQEDENFRILSFDANHVRLSTKVSYERFLVYNDSYDSGWRVFVNGKLAPCYQVNIAFKGTWLPVGQSIVEFRYGYWWQYLMNIALLFGGFIFIVGIIWFGYKEK